MTVLYRIQNLVERDSKEISAIWKVSMILICTTSAIGALTTYVSQGRLYEGFGGSCVLGSHLVFEEVKGVSSTKAYEYNVYESDIVGYELEETQSEDETNSTTDPNKEYCVDIHKTHWGRDSLCQFCQYVPVMSILLGVFWATMFSACPRGGVDRHGLSKPWRILPAALFFHSAIAVCSYLASSHLSNGITAFCKEFANITNVTECSDAIDNFTQYFQGDRQIYQAFQFSQFSILGSWTSTGCWILGALLLVLRFLLLVDFQISTMTLTTLAPEESLANEEIQRQLSNPEGRSLIRHLTQRNEAVTTV